LSDSLHRSFEPITFEDLTRLSQIALDDFSDLFARSEYARPYKPRLRLLCLCQGAARHFVHRDRGIHDFDVWGFFREIPDHAFPYRRRGVRDFGTSKFGRDPELGPSFTGRHVDVIGRSIPIAAREMPVEAVQRYLRERRTESARLLAERPVVALWPDSELGRVIWDGTGETAGAAL
jgi:hypothetical protein